MGSRLLLSLFHKAAHLDRTPAASLHKATERCNTGEWGQAGKEGFVHHSIEQCSMGKPSWHTTWPYTQHQPPPYIKQYAIDTGEVGHIRLPKDTCYRHNPALPGTGVMVYPHSTPHNPPHGKVHHIIPHHTTSYHTIYNCHSNWHKATENYRGWRSGRQRYSLHRTQERFG